MFMRKPPAMAQVLSPLKQGASMLCCLNMDETGHGGGGVTSARQKTLTWSSKILGDRACYEPLLVGTEMRTQNTSVQERNSQECRKKTTVRIVV